MLILFDADGDCPRELAPQIEQWACAVAAPCPCAVVIAKEEYEAWFLATVESLRGKRGIRRDAPAHPAPESVRGAKEALEERMVQGQSYMERTDQPALSAQFDMAAAFARCRSFRRMVDVFGRLVAGAGAQLGDWPPPAWSGEQQ